MIKRRLKAFANGVWLWPQMIIACLFVAMLIFTDTITGFWLGS